MLTYNSLVNELCLQFNKLITPQSVTVSDRLPFHHTIYIQFVCHPSSSSDKHDYRAAKFR